jgi:hypothetical protein
MRLLLPGILLLIVVSCAKPTKNKPAHCEQYWTGTFYNKANNVVNTKIKRGKDYQVEEFFPTGAVCKFKIEWLDSCTYKLTYESGNEACSARMEPVIVAILETKENSCTVEAWKEGSTLKRTSELFKGM